MSTRIIFDKKTMSFDGKTIFVNEKNVDGFDTSYTVFNTETGNAVPFELSHSTGSEWDPNTVWVYKNKENGLELHISQDPKITQIREKNYLDAKIHK